jgi:hypothetical protein
VAPADSNGMMKPSKSIASVPKFRETLWFKKGELDAEEAQLAADGDDDLRPGAVDLLPVEDRYCGPVHDSDTSKFGVHSGTTQAVGVERAAPTVPADVTESELVAEMKGRPAIALGCVAAGLCAFGVLIAQLL